MSLTGIIFFTLKWIEILVLYISGRALETTKTRKGYWKIAIAPILAFGLVEGLRWGRLIDWNNAVVEYGELNSIVNDRNLSNPLYTIVLYILKSMGLPYSFFVVLQCGFLMFSAIFLLQDYKKYLRWILPCLIMAFVNNENFIRYYFSQSFLFIAIYYYLNRSTNKYIIYSVLTVLTHFAQIPFVLILSFSRFLNNKQIPRIIGIVLYVVGVLFIDVSQMGFLVTIADRIVSLFGVGSEYRIFSSLANMSDIINGTAYGTEGRLFTKSILAKATSLLLYVPVIWMAPSCLKNERYGKYIFNLTVINLILTPVLGQAELLSRFTLSFNIFVVISFASIIAKSIRQRNDFMQIYVYLMLFIYFYAFLNAPFVREDYMMYFLWDSNGAATNFTPYYY